MLEADDLFLFLQVKSFLGLVRTNTELEEQGKPIKEVCHNRVFLGNPGTGERSLLRVSQGICRYAASLRESHGKQWGGRVRERLSCGKEEAALEFPFQCRQDHGGDTLWGGAPRPWAAQQG